MCFEKSLSTSAIRSRSPLSLATSQRTWQIHFLNLFFIMRFNNCRVRSGLAVKLSSQKKNDLVFLDLISLMVFSALRKRYFRPNILVTEQKLQSKGHPRDVEIGMTKDGIRYPLIKEKSGIGKASRSSTALPWTIGSLLLPSTTSMITSSASPTTTCLTNSSASPGKRLA